MKKRRTYGTTEVAEKDSVSLKRVAKKVEGMGRQEIDSEVRG
jgi:hypothetical protein